MTDWARTRSSETASAVSATGEVIPEGMRESTLMSMAGTMWKRGFCAEAVLAALWAQNLQACIPPLENEDINRIAKSVARYERNNLDVSLLKPRTSHTSTSKFLASRIPMS